MPLFGHDKGAWHEWQAGVPGLAEVAVAQGWQPAPGMYGVPTIAAEHRGVFVGSTVFTDAFQGNLGGRTVIVANGWTPIGPGSARPENEMRGVAVCAAELPSILPVACVQPRRFPLVMPMRESPTGDPEFDQRFSVVGAPGLSQQVLMPDLRARIMARDDWIFRADEYLLGCVSKGPFRTADEVSQRIGEVLAIVAAIPASVMPEHVDHSADDLIARISHVHSIEDALALLRDLTPDDRERLARSDTPLAVMADVRTPEEAMARFQALDGQQKMQLFAMFSRVSDAERGY